MSELAPTETPATSAAPCAPARARTRVVHWSDPLEAARSGAKLTGLEYLRGIAEGTFPQPPLAEALAFRLTEVSHGRAVFACVTEESHYNLIGTVHGGLAAALLDSATGCAVMSTLGAGDQWTTLSLQVDFLAGMDRDTGLVLCEAQVVRVGRRVGVAEARVCDSKGRLYARGSTTCLVQRA